MATYHNDFDKDKDPMMWELHEIRNRINKEKLTPGKINEKGKKILSEWKEKKNNKLKAL
jgi:hypothetical protein